MTMTTLVGMIMSTYEMVSAPFGRSSSELCCRTCPPQSCPNLVVILTLLMMMMTIGMIVTETHCKSLQSFPCLSLISNLAQADLEGNAIYKFLWMATNWFGQVWSKLGKIYMPKSDKIFAKGGLDRCLGNTQINTVYLTGIMRPGTKTTFFLVLTSAMSSDPTYSKRE